MAGAADTDALSRAATSRWYSMFNWRRTSTSRVSPQPVGRAVGGVAVVPSAAGSPTRTVARPVSGGRYGGEGGASLGGGGAMVISMHGGPYRSDARASQRSSCCGHRLPPRGEVGQPNARSADQHPRPNRPPHAGVRAPSSLARRVMSVSHQVPAGAIPAGGRRQVPVGRRRRAAPGCAVDVEEAGTRTTRSDGASGTPARARRGRCSPCAWRCSRPGPRHRPRRGGHCAQTG